MNLLKEFEDFLSSLNLQEYREKYTKYKTVRKNKGTPTCLRDDIASFSLLPVCETRNISGNSDYFKPKERNYMILIDFFYFQKFNTNKLLTKKRRY